MRWKSIWNIQPGSVLVPLFETLGAQRWQAGNTELLIYYGKPAPYHVTQEIYVDFLPQDEKNPLCRQRCVENNLSSRKYKKTGEYFLWLPGGKTLNPGTAFYLPRPQGTLTIPATARRVISVGAYDARQKHLCRFLRPRLSRPPISKTRSCRPWC